MRLDKFIAHATGLTRQQAQRTVRGGGVCVNGEVVYKPERHVQAEDNVLLNDEPVKAPQSRYFMLYKPAGYVCANHDSSHPVVLDLLPEPHKETLQIVGRLDIDTTGLVLITDDGTWNHRITAPSSHCSKCYRVALHQPLPESAAEILRSGIQLDGEKKPTEPALLSYIDGRLDLVYLTISEGKYHQVKRMFAAVGNHVLVLHRESIGNVFLDPALSPGEYRALTESEVKDICQ